VVIVKTRLKKYTLNSAFFKNFIQKMLHELKYDDFDITILFTTNKTIRELNKTFRKKDKATDILSFPRHPDLKAGARIKVHYEDEKELGDIIIAVEYTAEEAKKYGVTLEKRIELLLAHGIAHLLGHDHIKDNEYRVMRRLEERLLRAARATT
jgi:probable rRNA maturation factor